MRSPFIRTVVDKLLAAVNLFDFTQQSFGREQILLGIRRPDTQITNHPLFIDNHVRALGQPSRLIIDAIGLHDLTIAIAQKRIVDLREVGKSLLRKGLIYANSKHLSVLCLEDRIVVRPGRLQVFNSGRTEIEHVKIDKNILAF